MSSPESSLSRGVAVHRLGQQLGDVSAQIGHDPAARNGLAAETVPVVEQGRAVVVGEDLQIDPELLAVAEDRPVVVGDAGRPHVRVQVILATEVHPLPAVGFLQHVPAAGGEAAPPGPVGGLQDGAVVAGLRQLPGGGHTGDAGPQDHDTFSGARAGRQFGRGRMGGADSREPQGFHGPVDGLNPGHRADGLEELPFGHRRVHRMLSRRTPASSSHETAAKYVSCYIFLSDPSPVATLAKPGNGIAAGRV